MNNAINWFEIPAADFDRAVTFYRTILNVEIGVHPFGGVPHGFLPASEDGVGGAIVGGAVVEGSAPRPSTSGPLLYLNAAGQLDAILSRVEAAGGKVVTPATPIPPQGAIAVIIDSEGNRIGFHTPPM